MIIVNRETRFDIPLLIVSEDHNQNDPLPTMLYIHGFTSSKEINLSLAYWVANKGYRVILMDCLYHGERKNELSSHDLDLHFWDIVNQNLKDIQTLKDDFETRGLLLDGRFGVAGTSMGGITTCAALVMYPWIKVGACLMGSPKTVHFFDYLLEGASKNGANIPFSDEELEEVRTSLTKIDLSQNIEALGGRPMFFWHGDADRVVPFDHSYDFYNAAIQHYKNPESIRFLREPGRDHKTSRFALMETADWFELHL